MILAWLSAAFIIGVLAGPWRLVPVPAIVFLALALVAAAWFFRRHAWSAALLIVAAFLCGALRSPHAYVASPGDVAYYDGGKVQLQGVVAAEPDIRDTGANYVVAAHALTVENRTIPVSGLVQVHTPRSEQLEFGDGVSLAGLLYAPRNSAAGPFRDILAQRGIHTEMRFPRLVDLGPSSSGWLGWVVPLRQRLESGIDAWLPEPEAALLIAVTLGARSASLGQLAPVLVKTGLIHVIAISGIKVALVAGMIYWLAWLPRRRLVALILPLASLTVYVLITGATASGERSALMWGLVFVSAYLGRGTVAVVSLAFVAVLMVALDPSLPWDIGFQLSTVGTFAIVAFSAPLMRWGRVIPSPFREALCVTVAAQLGTLPIVAVGWHVVSGIGPIANALVLPVLPVLIVLGFLLGVSSGVSILAAPTGAFAYALLHLLVQVAEHLAALPGSLPAGTVSPEFASGYYVVLAALAWRILRRVHWAPVGRSPGHARELCLAAAIAASSLTLSVSHAQAGPRARLYWLGSGDSFLLTVADRTALIDGSSQPLALLDSIGTILPYTTRTIDLIVVTDPRATNVSGLEAVLRHYTVSDVMDVGAEYVSTTYARWRSELRARHIPVYALRTGASTRLGPVLMTAVGPDTLYPDPRNCIGLLRLSTGTYSILLAGMSSKREQREAVFRRVQLRAERLMLDGRYGYDPSFVEAVHPSLLLSQAASPGPTPARRLQAGQVLSMDL